MKKLLLTVTLCLACAAAFAQGKVRLVNDSLHLVYFDPGSNGGTNAGQAYVLGMGGQTLTIELWAGTASTGLSRVAVTDFSGQGSAGTWAGANITLPSPNYPAGLTYFTIDIYDIAAGSYAAASTTAGHFYGTSGLFTSTASGVTAYFSLVQHGSPGLSTWTDGTYNLDTISPGFRGSVMLTQVPEPTTIALAGLGAAALMIFRRRK
jgi:hypothetical protein